MQFNFNKINLCNFNCKLVFCFFFNSSVFVTLSFFSRIKQCYNRVMSAYIEYVILDNFVVTYAIASLTYRIMLKRVCLLRAAIASFIGTAVAVFYPFIKGDALVLIIKIVLWGILSLILFLKKEKFFMCALTFLSLTFLFGGVMFGIGFIVSGDASEALRLNMLDFPVSAIILGVFLCWWIVKKISVKFHRIRDLGGVIYDFSLSILGNTMKFRGLMDTGNRLYDKVSGLPVIVLSAKSLMGNISDEQFRIMFSGRGDTLQPQAHYMEISTVAGGKNKILLLKPDAFVLYSARGGNILYDVMVGVSFSPIKDAIGYDAILHPALI